MKSKNPSKQRKEIYSRPLHRKRKLLAAHLSKVLRKQLKRRSLPVRSGDEVLVARGEFAGKNGKISEVNLKRMKVYIDGLMRKKVSGKEAPAAFEASNLIITNPVLEDPKRKLVIERVKTKTEGK